MSELTGTQMKYLHVIYMAQEEDGDLRSVDISRELDVTKASVSRMVKLLGGLGFIAVGEYGNIQLTSKGKCEGAKIDEKIAQIYRFFVDYLELEEPEAINSAYSFLYNFSDNCIDQLVRKGREADWALP